MLELLAGVKLTYLAEGAANIVYRISLPSQPDASDGSHARGLTQGAYAGKLLRLRKKITSGTPYAEITRKFNSQIRSLFRDDELVCQDLIRLPAGLAASCNEKLKDDEAHNRRPRKRCGVYLCTDEPFGLLVRDMTTAPGSGATLWEFKPKWLTQSPSAPANARRCRTCALREKRNLEASQGPAKGGPEHHHKKSFCPFKLASNNLEDVLSAITAISNSPDAQRVATFMHRNPTLLKLRDKQRQMNAVGLPGIHASAEERAISMTLRDCTMFVKVPHKHDEPFELRLGDLDFKSEDGGKLQYWQDIETELIEGGWYLGTHRGQQNSECAVCH
ncbi:Inositol-pentakisphosphate 2-kinase [Microsporum ferrugineum]